MEFLETNSSLVFGGIASLVGLILVYALVSLRSEFRRYREEQSTVQAEKDRQLENALLAQGQVEARLSLLEERKLELEQELEKAKRYEAEKFEAEKVARQFETQYQSTLSQLEELKAQAVLEQEKFQALSKEQVALTEKHAKLESTLEERERSFRQQLSQFEEQKVALNKEFENIANKIFEEKGKTFSQDSKSSLESLLKPFREQISEFRVRVDTLQKENSESNVGLHKELEHLRNLNQEISADAKNLTTALKGDKKQTGTWGEIQLEKTLQLAGLVKGDHYESQVFFEGEGGKRNYPDFVINLPDKKHIVIDSKVSLVDYDAAIAAETEEQLEQSLSAHTKAVKKHINDLAEKDYSNLIGMRSPSFVLMFMPIEPAYIEAMKHSNDLFNYGYQKGVILVSHTTLMPILKTVANLWAMEQSHQEVRDISDRAGEVYNQVCMLAERLHKLGATLASANNHYNSTVKALAGQQGLYGKVDRFSKLSNKATKTMPALEARHNDIELEKLEAIRVESDDNLTSIEDEVVKVEQ